MLEIMQRLRDERGATIFYSTHILEDVQRISDAAAILKAGELVAQAPIQDLLAEGAGGSAVYELLLRGTEDELRQVRARIEVHPWVSSVEEVAGLGGGRCPEVDGTRHRRGLGRRRAAAGGSLAGGYKGGELRPQAPEPRRDLPGPRRGES